MTIRAPMTRLCAAALVVLTTACARSPEIEPVLKLGEVHNKAPADALYEAGKAHLLAGRIGLAVHTLETARLQAPASVEVLNALGAAYDRLGRHHLAEKVYLDALALAPDDPMTLNNIGWSRHLRGQSELAEYYLRQAVDLEPANPTARANLAQVVAKLPARPKQARPDLRLAQGPRIERVGEQVQQLTFEDLPPVAWPPVGSAPVDTIEVEPVVVAQRVARMSTPPAALKAPEPARDPGTLAGLRMEIANGTGRTRMAARFAKWLRGEGLPDGRLRNAAHFGHSQTVISYSDPAHLQAARALADLLPSDVVVRQEAGQGSDIRVILGADLLTFDDRLLTEATHKRNPSDAVSHPTV